MSLIKRFAVVLVIFMIAVSIGGCRTAMVYNVQDAQVVTGRTQPNMARVGDAIMHAGSSLGWQMQKHYDGHIIGTLTLRTHQAVVDILYDTRNYSILYRDSQNLKYDGQTIHKNYNGWVSNLDARIRTELTNI